MADVDYTLVEAQNRSPSARARVWERFVHTADGAFTLALILGIGFWCYEHIAPDVSGVKAAHIRDVPIRAEPERQAGRPTNPRGLVVSDHGLIIAPPPVEITRADIPVARVFRSALRSEPMLVPKIDGSAQAYAADALAVRISPKDEPVSEPVTLADPVSLAIDVIALPEPPEPVHVSYLTAMADPVVITTDVTALPEPPGPGPVSHPATAADPVVVAIDVIAVPEPPEPGSVSNPATAADPVVVAIDVTAVPEPPEPVPVSDPFTPAGPIFLTMNATAVPERPEAVPALSHVSQGPAVSLRPQSRPVDSIPFILGTETAQTFATAVDEALAFNRISPNLTVSLRPLKRSIAFLSPVVTPMVIQTSVSPFETDRPDAPTDPSVEPVDTGASNDQALTEFNQWLEQFGDGPVPQTITVNRDMGGSVYDYAWEVAKAAHNGAQVQIRGPCVSACTLFLSMPKDQVCITRGARFSFHLPYGATRQANQQAAEFKMRRYPEWVRSWIASKGGLTKNMIHMSNRYASRFMNTCGAEPAPVYVSSEPAVETLLTAVELSGATSGATKAARSDMTPSHASFEPKRVSAQGVPEREGQIVDDR